MTPLAAAHDVTRVFAKGPLATRVLHGIDIVLPPNELVLLIGPSGSGKTTLVSILAGVMRPTTGTVRLCGELISDQPECAVARVRRANLGFVFQTYNLFPALTALENVASVLRMRGARSNVARTRAAEALARVALSERATHRPHELSGGQRQRVAIARALVTGPRLLVGDEITAALDWPSAQLVMDVVRGFVNPTAGALLVTHDRRLERWADRVIEIAEGRLVYDGAPKRE